MSGRSANKRQARSARRAKPAKAKAPKIAKTQASPGVRPPKVELNPKHAPIVEAFNGLRTAAGMAQGVGCNEQFFDRVKQHGHILGTWLQKTLTEIAAREDNETKTKGAKP